MTAVAYGSLPFSEQIAFFRRKQNVLTESWTDLWQEEHDHAFMVAGANRIDLLVDLRAAVDQAINQGGGIAQFRRDFDQIVAKHGWAYNGGRDWRTRVIYETNLRTSYAAGRYAQLQAVKADRPYWRYRHSDSVQHPRPMHLAWNGLVLGADDPWWTTHYPPNGWGCKCTVEALNQRDIERLGKRGPDRAPDENPQESTVGARGPAPRTVTTPAGVDPGFGYAPGASAYQALIDQTLSRAAALPAPAAAAALSPILQLGAATDGLDAGFAQWADAIAADPVVRARAVAVGALTPETVAWLGSNQQIEPATATIVMRDEDYLHMIRAAKRAPLAADVLRRIPALLRERQAVLYDVANDTLLYVFDAGSSAGKLVIRVNYRLKGADDPVNLVRTGAYIDRKALLGGLKGGKLRLIEGALQ